MSEEALKKTALRPRQIVDYEVTDVAPEIMG